MFYVVVGVKVGEILIEDYVCLICPGNGFVLKYLDDIFGKLVVCDFVCGELFDWGMINL